MIGNIHKIVILNVAWAALTSGLGCVSVDTPNTKVNVGLPSWDLPKASSSKSDEAAYARPLRKVGEQQSKVAKHMARHEWEDVVDKSSDWADRIRELSSHAQSTHDPQLLRDTCNELLAQVHALRQAAMHRDRKQAQQAFDACDPLLSRLIRSFPPEGATTARPSDHAARPAPSPPAASNRQQVP